MDRKVGLATRDIELIKEACLDDKTCPFTKFSFKDGVFSFEYNKLNNKVFYWITITDDYPDHSMLTKCNNESGATHDVCYFSDRLPVLFTSIAKDVYKDFDQQLISRMEHNRCSYESDSDSLSTSDEEEEGEGYQVYDGENDQMEESHMHTQLTSDIEAVKDRYSPDSIVTRSYAAIDDIDIELHVPIDGIDDIVAKAWRIVPNKPLIVSLNLSVSRYFGAHQLPVNVYQTNDENVKEKCGIHIQMEKILSKFIKETSAVTFAQQTSSHCSPHTPSGEHAGRQGHSDNHLLPTSNETNSLDGEDLANFELKVAHLVELGFGREPSANALLSCRGDVNSAADLLIAANNNGSVVDSSAHVTTLLQCGFSREDALNALFVCNNDVEQALIFLTDSASSTSLLPTPWPRKGKKLKAKLSSHNQKTSPMTPLETKKVIPTLEHGYLVQIMLYAQQRLRTLNEFCVICDEAHVFGSGSMLKPAVCSRELCVFSFQTLGVMANAADEIATGPEVVDLLIAMANAACRSTRREAILEPFPTVVDPNSSQQLAFNPRCKDFVKVQKTIDNIVQMSHTLCESPNLLKMKLDSTDPLAFPMLQWIISSNRSHIVKLPPKKQLKFMNTPHQFLLRSSPPEKESAFVEARKKYNSTFAFHGSNIENWHSIVRQGLLNASGTRYQLHGTAYGEGIYLSPASAVSFEYSYGVHRVSLGMRASGNLLHHASASTSKPPNNCDKDRPTRLQNKDITCIALCEVILSPSLKKSNDRIWVMPEPDHVCTRFFFVYERGQQAVVDVTTTSADVLAMISTAMHDVYS